MKTVSIALVCLVPVCAAPVVQATPRAASAPLPTRGEIEDLIARGRALLESGQHAEALALFEQAERLDKASLRTRMWTLRAWIAQGRVNDALDAIDALSRTTKGPAIDYLYGMAFAAKGKGYVAEGVTTSVVGMSFTDAIEYLKRATAADPELFRDAFLPLAESAWYGQEIETAHAAAQKAVELRPQDPEAFLVQGRVELSRYVALREDAGRKDDAESSWTASRAAFVRAAELLAKATEPAQRAKRADALSQVGWLAIWKNQGEEAAKAFTSAIAADPVSVDYAGICARLTPEQFVTALEEAHRSIAGAEGPSSGTSGQGTTGGGTSGQGTGGQGTGGQGTAGGGTAGQGTAGQGTGAGAAPAVDDSSLLWWLGYGRYALKRYGEAETALAAAVAKAPAFTNSWYYIALARYFQQDYDGAIAAWRKHYEVSAEDCIAALKSNEAENMRILEYLIAMKAGKNAHLDAAFLAELQTGMQPTDARLWNNLGLFLRDEGEARERRGSTMSPEAHAAIMDLYERAYAAYSRCLELAPEDPNYLNDTALMLHYHLDRDLDKARAWYVKAAERAQAELERRDLSSQLRSDRELALRDARNNLRDLDALLEKRRKGGG